jgi:hypothetical protein
MTQGATAWAAVLFPSWLRRVIIYLTDLILGLSIAACDRAADYCSDFSFRSASRAALHSSARLSISDLGTEITRLTSLRKRVNDSESGSSAVSLIETQDTSFFSKSLVSVVVGAVNFDFDGWKANANSAFSKAIAERSPMSVTKNVLIDNFSEHQYDGGGIVEIDSVALRLGLLIWSNDAQFNLLRLLLQCVEIGVSIRGKFYCEVRPDEALFREGLARVLEQHGGGSWLMRSTPNAYSIRCYPSALIEMHVFFRENNTFFGGSCALPGCDRSTSCKPQPFIHVADLEYIDDQLQHCRASENSGEHENPIGRRFITVLAALLFSGFVLFRDLTRFSIWLTCCALVFFAGSMLLLFLTGFSWSWGWWW